MKHFNKFVRFAFTSRKGPHGGALKIILQRLWDVYSKPTPAAKEVLTLLSLCFIIAMLTGGLLYHLLSEILSYGPGTSTTAACIYSVVIFLLTFLFHPLRCVLTMALPTLCTKQGRKLVISSSVMVLVLNVIPNIIINLGAVMNILKCTSEGFAQTLLNSSQLFNGAKEDLVKETLKVNPGVDIAIRLTEFHHFTYINVSNVKSQFVKISSQIESDFSRTKHLLEECKHLSNRILTAIFLIYLIVESARYLHSYLTSVKFDNVYLSGELMQNASNNGVHITGTKNMVNSMNFKITKQEFSKCLSSLVVVTLYFTAVVFIIASDHIVYNLVTQIKECLLEVPITTVNIGVTYKVQLVFPRIPLIDFNKDYEGSFSPSTLLCDAEPSAPDRGLRVLLGLLFLLSNTMVFLEIYARRVRRTVSASFYRKQEEKRMEFLRKKMQIKHARNEENKDIFHITIAQGVGPETP